MEVLKVKLLSVLHVFVCLFHHLFVSLRSYFFHDEVNFMWHFYFLNLFHMDFGWKSSGKQKVLIFCYFVSFPPFFSYKNMYFISLSKSSEF